MAPQRWPDGDGAVGNHGTVTADCSQFDDLYQREWSGLVALGWTLTGSWQTAEELVQDAFADAYARWPEVAGMERPGAWVRRAVVNRSASVHRSRSAERRANDRWGTRSGVDADTRSSDATGDRATDHVSDPDFWAAVRSLPERQA
ncbi:MAG: sigma factor, partial [Aquihabitans sp.]